MVRDGGGAGEYSNHRLAKRAVCILVKKCFVDMGSDSI